MKHLIIPSQYFTCHQLLGLFLKRQGLVEVIIRDGVLCDYGFLLLSPMRANLLRHFARILWDLKMINNEIVSFKFFTITFEHVKKKKRMLIN